MPWTEKMQQKQEFIATVESGLYPMAEACRRHGITRPTGYLWWDRYLEGGLEGLEERSRAPLHCPHQTPAETLELLLAMKMTQPTWGAPKLRDWLRTFDPGMEVPATSTIHRFLDEHGLVKKRRRKPGWRHPGTDELQTEAPNDIWTTDFKGQFLMGNGVYCYPLTVCDQHSRFVIDVTALPSIRNVGVVPVFTRLFEEYGLPRAIHSDNGVPFCTTAVHGFSSLSIWWLKLGIRHSRMRPACPFENGAHERMHRTLKAETALPPQQDFQRQQECFDSWRDVFNNVRPHEFLDGETPGSKYQPSPRPFPKKLFEPSYPDGFIKRRVTTAGTFRLARHLVYVSTLLNGDWVALEEIQDGIWSLYYYDLLLGRIDERDGSLKT